MVELSFSEGREHIVSMRALCAQNFAMRAQKAQFSHYKGHFWLLLAISSHLNAL